MEQQVIDLINNKKSMSTLQLAEELGLSKKKMNIILKKLHAEGKVIQTKRGAAYYYRTSKNDPIVKDLIDQHKNTLMGKFSMGRPLCSG